MSIYKHIPTEALQRGIYQPRKTFDKPALEELAQSILTQGLIEPLIVRELSPERYEIIAGERRWRASILAGLTEVPCLIGTYTNQQAAAVTLIENIQRQELNLIEEAGGYDRLLKEFHFSQEEIASLVGKSRSHIANILRLLSLNSYVQEHIQANKLTLGHARALVGLPTHQQIKLTNQILQEGWSVRRLEEHVRLCKQPADEEPSPAPSNDRTHLEAQLAEHMGTPVKIISDSQDGGWLHIKFFDNDTLSGLLERLGLRYD